MSITNGLISASSSTGSAPVLSLDAAMQPSALSSPAPVAELEAAFRPAVNAAPALASAAPAAPAAPAAQPASVEGRAGRQPSTWWHAGVYCSAPAVFLWVVAHLPADMLAQLFRGPAMPVVLNQLGDALFVCGWAISGILLWGSRRRLRG
ncbi:hypothetical protein [Paracidovorax citrulli]